MPAPLGVRSRRGYQAILAAAAVVPVFDPATLTLSQWNRANYSSAPWAGNASVGASAGRALVSNGGFDPDPGAALNGKIPAAFTAANSDTLKTSVNNNVLFGTTSLSFFVLFKANSAPAPNAAPYADGNLLTDLTNAETTFGITTAGITACLYDGAFQKVTVACSTGAWHLGQFKLTGGQLKARVDSGAWSSVACGTLPYLTPGAVFTGSAYSGASFFNGLIAEWGTSALALSDAEFDSIKSYINSTYGLSL